MNGSSHFTKPAPHRCPIPVPATQPMAGGLLAKLTGPKPTKSHMSVGRSDGLQPIVIRLHVCMPQINDRERMGLVCVGCCCRYRRPFFVLLLNDRNEMSCYGEQV